MSLTSEEMRDAVDRYFAARNSLDPAACAACFTDDAIVHDPYGSTPIEGAVAIREFFDGLANVFRDFKVVAESIYPSGDRAAVLFRRTGVGKNGKPVTVEGVNVFEFNHAGRISGLWSYWDAAAVLAQLKS
ncbi:MAG TPA: nuclear transport factor 2 family protein [Nitrospira sp.]|nr:nuclear transport factor 2 family protein [Nitrospira sp.]